jgi:hypothetical protein
VFDKREDAVPCRSTLALGFRIMVLSDVSDFVVRRFNAADQRAALSLLSTAILDDGSVPTPRQIRCAAVASNGSMAKLQYYVKMLTVDWRDVISAGEYDFVDGKVKRVRDLSVPIEDEF